MVVSARECNTYMAGRSCKVAAVCSMVMFVYLLSELLHPDTAMVVTDSHSPSISPANAAV